MRVDRSCNPISNSISIPFGVYGLICHSQAENNNVWGNNKESCCVSLCVCLCWAYQRVFIRRSEVTHTTTPHPLATRTSNLGLRTCCEPLLPAKTPMGNTQSIFDRQISRLRSVRKCEWESARAKVNCESVAFLFLFHSSHLRRGVCVCVSVWLCV